MVTMLPVAFTGAPGAYSEEAAQRYFGTCTPTLTCGSIEDALEAVQSGRAGHAVAPVENTVTGYFAGLVEALFDRDLSIVGEVELLVRHCLLGVPGARLDEVAVVTSHPSALSQCRDWLAGVGVATRTAADTGRAAEELMERRDPALAVLGRRGLADRHGLAVLAEGLSDKPDNRTRFYVFAPTASDDTGATRTAALFGPDVLPRELKTLRIQLESHGARRTRSPFLGAQDGARFLVEFDHRPGGGVDLANASFGRPSYRVLGSWRP